MAHDSAQRTHTAAVGLTFDEWNSWRGAAKEAGHEHTSDWVREVVAAAIDAPAASPAGDPKRELARELANIGAQLGALTDELNAAPTSDSQQAALAGADRAANELARLAQTLIDRW